MLVGITVLVLLFIRLLMRWRFKRPEWATTGSSFLDKVGQWTHVGLYLLAFAVTITGLILALQTNRLSRIFSVAGSTPGQFRPGGFQPGQFPSPEGFQPGQGRPRGAEGGFARGGRFFLGAFHGLSWTLLLLLIVLHIGAAFYHQFFRKDNLLGRMWFGGST
jgi:cytochrome b561